MPIRVGDEGNWLARPMPYTSEEIAEALTTYTPQQVAEHLNTCWMNDKSLHNSMRMSEGRRAAQARKEINELRERVRELEEENTQALNELWVLKHPCKHTQLTLQKTSAYIPSHYVCDECGWAIF